MPEQLAPPVAPFGRIVRRFTAADGTPASGAVVFTPRSPAADGGTAIVDASIVAVLDDEGWIRQDLVASDAGGAFRTYLVALRSVRYGFDQETAPAFDIVVTAGQEDDLGTLAPVPPAAGTTPVVDESTARRAEEAAARAVAAADRAEAAGGGTGPSGGREFPQLTPLATWTIAHALGRRPLVTLYDLAGTEIETDISATATAVTVTFPEPTAGSVVLS